MLHFCFYKPCKLTYAPLLLLQTLQISLMLNFYLYNSCKSHLCSTSTFTNPANLTHAPLLTFQTLQISLMLHFYLCKSCLKSAYSFALGLEKTTSNPPIHHLTLKPNKTYTKTTHQNTYQMPHPLPSIQKQTNPPSTLCSYKAHLKHRPTTRKDILLYSTINTLKFDFISPYKLCVRSSFS